MSIYKVDDDHIYYNIEIRGNNTPNGISKIAHYVDSRSDPIIYTPEDYHMSVIRASITGTNVPLFIFENLGPNGSKVPNNAFYGLTLINSATNTPYQRFVQYVPNAPTTFIPSTIEDYYTIYSYQSFINMINTTFTNAFNDLKTAHPLNPCSQAPYIKYDVETKLFSLIVQKQYIGNIEVWMNNKLYKFFEAFDVFYNGFNMPNGKDIRINLYDDGTNCFSSCPKIVNNITITSGSATITSAGLFNNSLDNCIVEGTGIPPNTIATVQNLNTIVMTQNATATGTVSLKFTNNNLLKIIQDYDTTYLWSDVQSIIFTSSMIPVKDEFTPTLTDSTAEASQRILTDFEPGVRTASDTRAIYSYVPTSEYRRIDLRGINPLNAFDLQVYWKDKNGFIHNIYILPYNSPITVKILFEKKNKLRIY